MNPCSYLADGAFVPIFLIYHSIHIPILLPLYGNASSYRIRPLGPEETLFEVWALTLFPEGEEPESPTTPTPIPFDDPSWPEVLGQDFDNLPKQQVGLHSKGFESSEQDIGQGKFFIRVEISEIKAFQ